ncbi:MAG: hypothetical protein AB1610_08785 [Nitrospirota bacterium]
MKKIVNCFLVLIIVIPNISLAIERPLKTERAEISDVTGTFTVILYGGRYSDDIETIAFLDLEGDEYNFTPYAPEFDYKIKKEIPANEAIKEAERFVSFHNSFWHSRLNRIIDKQGYTMGYEVRPLYLPVVFGASDVLDVYYWIKEGGRIKITIRLIPSVERRRLIGDDAYGGGDH